LQIVRGIDFHRKTATLSDGGLILLSNEKLKYARGVVVGVPVPAISTAMLAVTAMPIPVSRAIMAALYAVMAAVAPALDTIPPAVLALFPTGLIVIPAPVLRRFNVRWHLIRGCARGAAEAVVNDVTPKITAIAAAQC
jgi:hypothetical protein